ncbi:MAG: ATP-binding protein [Myxococcales bacterium]|nr:ATP-binding protein [Myxococcales bacterium]
MKIRARSTPIHVRYAGVLQRTRHVRTVRRLLRTAPVVALLGPRQCGKTTLASLVAGGRATRFDLEDPRVLERLADPMLALDPLRGLVILDEVQRRPELFPAPRVLADRPRTPARFLVLGSATGELMHQSSESLAGRIAYHELGALALDEIADGGGAKLWRRGGFPRSYLARSEAESVRWREDFTRTFLERDLMAFGPRVPATTLFRFWSMLAHYHAQLWNGAELARAFAMSESTVRTYLDTLTQTFMVRQLAPWHENLAKRQVRAPKIYLSDAGILHALLGVRTAVELERHPKVGASWEGFALEQIVARLGVRRERCFFWSTHQGAELDLFVVVGGKRLGFEIKRTTAPRVTKSMRIALADLGLERLDVVFEGRETYPLDARVRALPLARIFHDLRP